MFNIKKFVSKTGGKILLGIIEYYGIFSEEDISITINIYKEICKENSYDFNLKSKPMSVISFMIWLACKKDFLLGLGKE